MDLSPRLSLLSSISCFLLLPFVCPQFLSCSETQSISPHFFPSDLRAGGFVLCAREMFSLAQACNQRGAGRRQGCTCLFEQLSDKNRPLFWKQLVSFLPTFEQNTTNKSTNSGMFGCREPFLESAKVHFLSWEYHKKLPHLHKLCFLLIVYK